MAASTSTASWRWAPSRLATATPRCARPSSTPSSAAAIGPRPSGRRGSARGRPAAGMPHLEQVRFLKTGAEAVAAAIRLARAWTGRDRVLGAGYFGWLDWCSHGAGVPEPVQRLYATIPFNDEEGTRAAIRAAGDELACVVIEPVIEAEPIAGVAPRRCARRRAGSARSSSSTRSRPRLRVAHRAAPSTLGRRTRPRRSRQGDRERLSPFGGGGPRGDHARSGPDLDFLHDRHRVRLAGRRRARPCGPRPAWACSDHLGTVGARLYAGLTRAACGASGDDHERRRHPRDVLPALRDRSNCRRAWRSPAPAAGSSSSVRPTTSCRSPTRKPTSMPRSGCWARPLEEVMRDAAG